MRALICLHGLLSTNADYDKIKKILNRNYEYISCPDLPGHGENSLKFNTGNIKKFLLQHYDLLNKKYSEIDVIGYSMGGVFACYLQSKRKINKLVLLAPSYRYLNLKNYKFIKSFFENEEKKYSKNSKKNFLNLLHFPKIISNLNLEFFVIYSPTLILWGKEDFLVKEEAGMLLYQMVKNPNKRYIQLDFHNHFNIIRSPLIFTYIKDFLENV